MTDHIPLGTGDGGGGGPPSGNAGGDLGGTYPNPSVVGVSVDVVPTLFTGVSTEATAGETLAFGDPVYVKSDGKVWKADANGTATFPAIGLCVVGAAAEAAATILLHGTAHDAAWNWTPGGVVYLSEAAGLTQTAPAFGGTVPLIIQQVAVAFTADDIYWHPVFGGVIPEDVFITPNQIFLADNTSGLARSSMAVSPGGAAAQFSIGSTDQCFGVVGNFNIDDSISGTQTILFNSDSNSAFILGDNDQNEVVTIDGGNGQALSFFGGDTVSQPTVTGAVTSIIDANAKAAIQSIVAALAAAGVNLVVDGTS